MDTTQNKNLKYVMHMEISFTKQVYLHVTIGVQILIATRLSQGVFYFKLQTKQIIINYLHNLFHTCYVTIF